MTSLIKPVPQREIEEKKQGSGERTAQILKKKAKGMNMDHNTLLGVLIPFVGTTAGAACVFFLKNELKPIIQKTLLGFASGVMVAASVWSLLIPSMNMCEAMGRLAFLPASIGFMVGILMLLLLDRLIPHLHLGSDEPEGHMCGLKKTTMLVLAVTLHNIPEGIAVSVPIYQATGSKAKAFRYSFLSGLAEPVGALLGWLVLMPIMNDTVYGVIFAAVAGIMVFISLDELLPAAREYGQPHIAIYGLLSGMAVMALSLILLS